jgi:soluble lytic murein transglycosylase
MKPIVPAALCALLLLGCQPPAAEPPAPAPAPTEPADPDPAPPPPADTPPAAVDEAAVAAATEDLRALLAGVEGTAGSRAEAVERVAERHPFVAHWVRLLGAEAAAAAGDTAAVARLHAAVPEALRREWGWRAAVNARTRAGAHPAAASEAERLAGIVQWEAGRARLWFMAAEARLAEGDSAGARTALNRAIDAGAGTPGALEAARLLSNFPRLDAAEHLRVGRTYLRAGNLARAASGIDAYLSAASPAASERDALLLELGRARFRQARYADAEPRLERASGAADTEVGAEALFLLARSQYRQGRQDQGRATFRRVADRFPDSRWAAEALFLVADLDHDAGDLTSAATLYGRVMQIAPTIEVGRVAGARLGGMRFIAGEYDRALESFRDLERGDAAAGAYWVGRTLSRLGREGEAREAWQRAMEADPVGYYGQLAAQRLDARSPVLTVAGRGPAVPAADQAEAALVLARYDVLRGVDRDDAAAFVRSRAEESLSTPARYPFAEGLASRGRVSDAVRLAHEIRRAQGWDDRLLRIVYPMPYQELVTRYARDRGLDPYFVAGLIRQESMFNPVAVSPAGAIGLMQVMPATGADLARRAGISPFDSSMLRDPELNVRLGTLFLRDMLARYDNDPVLALAAYNAGPTRATRWRNLPEFRDREVFVERIPFAETRHYAKVVQANAEIYRALYGN